MNTQRTLNFQIDLAQRMAKIYQKIGTQFPSKALSISKQDNLWLNLARDEQKHAALLQIEKDFLKTGSRVTHPVEISLKTQREIEEKLVKYEDQISRDISEAEAIQILKDLEGCDEAFFLPLLKATDSKLLSQFSQYSQTCRTHERRVQKGLTRYKNLQRRKSERRKIEFPEKKEHRNV